MSKIDAIRELHCYKKMYHLMQNIVIECAELCKDPVVKEKLIKAQQASEGIYTGEEYDYRDLTADELVIILLLSFIREREVSRGIGSMDIEAVYSSVDWNLALRNVEFHLSDAEIAEHLNRIFHSENQKQDSEQ